jgi:signal transduction histidine kinase
VILFETEVEPFQLSLLDSGHFVLFRRVWQDGHRLIQGALIEQQPLLRGGIESAFRETFLSQSTDLVVAWNGDVLSAYAGQASRDYLSSTEELHGALLLRTRLSAPLQGMELLFSVGRLPAGPGAHLLHWLAAALIGILCGGFYLMYRLGLRQIALARQQQDFVSAVSHELKTPLTSIRMYGELLREGWVPEEKRTTYYAYIHDESERLSRLIDNVLQLARMTRNDLRLRPQPVSAGELMEVIRSKVTSQVERVGFTLDIDCGADAAAAVVSVDADAFSQILINLVDNAIKFSAGAERKAVDIGCRLADRSTLVFWVRDYGPGVPPDQVRKIFRLFYRVDGGLTRQTAGTGIGLALVRQLAEAMGGTVNMVNREPGAEFSACFSRLR